MEDLRHIQRPKDAYPDYGGCPKQIMNPYMSMYHNNDESSSYSNLVYRSACDKLREKVQDGRTKYLISN